MILNNFYDRIIKNQFNRLLPLTHRLILIIGASVLQVSWEQSQPSLTGGSSASLPPFEDIYIDISTDDGTVELTISEVIELYELLPRVIEDAKNHNTIFGNRIKNDLQNRINELQKELDSLEEPIPTNKDTILRCYDFRDDYTYRG